jgi:hypothetical protein
MRNFSKEKSLNFYEQKINNVTFKFEKDFNIEEDFESQLIGMGYFHVPKIEFEKFIKWCNENKESMPDFDSKQKYYKNMEDNLFYIPYYYPDSYLVKYDESRERYIIESTDVIISFSSWLVNQDIECSIIMKYYHIMWFFHDLEHIRNDTDKWCNINVTHKSEYNAIYASLSRCKDEGIEVESRHMCLIDMFNSRFNTRSGYNFEDFFYENIEEDEEE